MTELFAIIAFTAFIIGTIWAMRSSEPGPCPKCGGKRTVFDYWDDRCTKMNCPHCGHYEKHE